MSYITKALKKIGNDIKNIVDTSEDFIDTGIDEVQTLVRDITKPFHKGTYSNKPRKHKNCPRKTCQFHIKKK